MKKSQASSLKPILGLLAVSLIVVVCGGCKEEPPPPPPTPEVVAPPEPTANQIAGEIRPILMPLQAALQPNGFWVPSAGPTMVKGLRDARAKNQAKQNGPAALSQISRELSDMVGEVRTQKRWKIVLAGIEAYEALEPDSTTFARVKATARLQMGKPKVKIKGFFVDNSRDNETYVWLELTDRTTRKTHTVRAREGEEFDGLRLVKIIGKQQGVTLEYLKIPGDFFDIMTQQ